MSAHLFQQTGAAGLVQMVALATQHGLTRLAETALRAMSHITAHADRLAAHNAGGGRVIAECLNTFPTSLGIARAALVAGLYRAWGGGLAPFHDARVPTSTVIQAVVAAMKRFPMDTLVQQGGVRLLDCHARSQHKLVETPSVVEAVAATMRAFVHDGTIQHLGASAIASVNGIQPSELKRAHAKAGYDAIHVTSVALAVSSPPSLQIGGRSWQEVVLATYPRLRDRA